MEQDVDSSDIILERIIMSYVKPGKLSNVDKEFGDKYNRARRSTETRRLSEGTTSMDKPFYWSNVVSGDLLVAIYNDTEPKERFYTNGLEVATRHIERGVTFSDNFYDEGCDHTRSYMYKDEVDRGIS